MNAPHRTCRRRIAARGVCRPEPDLQQHDQSGYRPYEYGYGAGRRDLTTVIVGNPFDIDQAELETRLVAMLNESPTFLQPTNFTTTPGPSARPQYRAVLLFNRATVLPNQICRSPEECRGRAGRNHAPDRGVLPPRRLLSTVTGELEGVAGIDDPRFRRLIRQMVPLLFPPVDPTEDDQTPFFITGSGLRRRARLAAASRTPARDRLAVHVRAQRLGRAAGTHRARREAAEAEHAIVHHDDAGGRQIDAEPGRDAHDVIAPIDHRRRQRCAPAEHVGGVQRVPEARQQSRRIQQLHADQHAALRQDQLLDGIEPIERHLLRLRCVGERVPCRVDIDQEHEAGAEGVRRADQIAQVHGLADALRPDAEIAAHSST